MHAVEEDYSYKDEDISVGGRIDLILERGENELAVVDLKWGGRSSKMKELLSEEELQLVIYDKLLADKKKTIYLNYYIISEGKFISRTHDAFKKAIVIPAIYPAEHRQFLWSKVVATYKMRLSELQRGQVEVGNGLLVSDLQEQFDIWQDKGHLMTPPIEGYKDKKTKRTNFYSKYDNLIGS